MLSDSHSKLLTAYVDGELAGRERQAAERLLASSPEARELLEKLQEDSKELQNAPSRQAPQTLADVVLETLNDQAPLRKVSTVTAPARVVRVVRATPEPRSIPRWLGFAAAACVLLAAGLGSFFLAGALLKNSKPEVVKTANPILDSVLDSIAKFGEPVPDEDIGIHLALADLHKDPVKLRLANELKKQPGFWFDVAATNSKGAIDRFASAFKQTGIEVLIDGTASKKLAATNQASIQYLLYVENLNHEEFGLILDYMAMAENKVALPSGRTMNQLVMRTMGAEDRGNLASLLHIDVKTLQPAPLGPDLQLPIDGDKGPGQKKTGAPKKSAERLAVVFLGSGTAQTSVEVRRFILERSTLRQGTLQMVFVIQEKS